jgi:Tfp pilus assembly protein PilF
MTRRQIKRRSQGSSGDSGPSRGVQITRIDIAYWLTVAAILIASLFPQERLWGVNWYGYFPWFWRVVAVGVAALGWLIARGISSADGSARRDGAMPFYGMAGILVVAITGLFVLLSVKTHFLGDGYLLITRVYAGVGGLRIWHTGPYALLNAVYSLVDEKSEAGARLAFQFISYGSGLVFLVVVALAAARLFTSNRHRLLFLVGVASGGHMLLYFGYVENYPPFVTLVTALCLVGTMIALGRLNRWWIVPIWAAAAMLHVFAVSLLPAVVYLLVSGTSLEGRVSGLSRAVKLSLTLAVVITFAALFAYARNRSYFFRFAWVPFFPDRFTVEGYHLFSGKHLLDCLNELLVLFPSAGVLILAVRHSGIRDAFRRTELRFLVLASAGALLLAFLVYPRLGMPRDWDVFSFSVVPILILCYYIILGGGTARISQPATAILSITLCCLVLAPRVATQFDTETSIAVFDNYAAMDKIRNQFGRYVLLQFLEKQGLTAEVERREKANQRDVPYELWVQQGIEAQNRGDSAAAMSLFRRALDANPQNAHAWLNYGVMLFQKGQNDSALTCMEIANGLNPDNCAILSNLGTVLYYSDQRERAVDLWKRACEIDANDFMPRAFLLRHYLAENRRSEFDVLLTQCIGRVNGSAAYDRGLGDFLIEGGQFEQASQVFRRALAKGLDSGYVRQLQQQYPQLQVID